MLFEILNKLTDGWKSSWFQINDNTNRVATSLKIKFLIKKFFSCKTYWRIITEWFVRNRLRFYICIFFRTSTTFASKRFIYLLRFLNLYFPKFVRLFIYIVFPIWIYKYWFFTIILDFLISGYEVYLFCLYKSKSGSSWCLPPLLAAAFTFPCPLPLCFWESTVFPIKSREMVVI